MIARHCFHVFCLSLALTTVNAQTAPAAREIPPDQKAFGEAGKLTDPAQKIAAYEKIKKDFPTGVYAGLVDNAVLNTLLKSMPEQKDRIRKTADAIYKAAVAKDKEASKANVIVSTRRRESASLQ